MDMSKFRQLLQESMPSSAKADRDSVFIEDAIIAVYNALRDATAHGIAEEELTIIPAKSRARKSIEAVYDGRPISITISVGSNEEEEEDTSSTDLDRLFSIDTEDKKKKNPALDQIKQVQTAVAQKFKTVADSIE